MGTLRTVKTGLTGLTANYPVTPSDVVTWYDADENAGAAYDIVDTGTAPSAATRVLSLTMAPLRQSGMTITAGGAARRLTAFGQQTAGEIGVDWAGAQISTDPADDGAALVVTYRGLGSAPDATFLNQLQLELKAVTERGIRVPSMVFSRFLPGAVQITGGSDWLAKISLDSARIATATLARVSIEAAPALQTPGFSPSGTTTIQVADSTAFSNKIDVSLGVSDSAAAQTGAVAIDVAGGEAIYIRCSASGGHENISVTVEVDVNTWVAF